MLCKLKSLFELSKLLLKLLDIQLLEQQDCDFEETGELQENLSDGELQDRLLEEKLVVINDEDL